MTNQIDSDGVVNKLQALGSKDPDGWRLGRLGATAAEFYALRVNNGNGGLDMSSTVKLIEDEEGL